MKILLREKVSLFFLFYVSNITQAYIMDFLGGVGGRWPPRSPLALPVWPNYYEICFTYLLQGILFPPADAIQHPTDTHPYLRSWGGLLHSPSAIISLSHGGGPTMHEEIIHAFCAWRFVVPTAISWLRLFSWYKIKIPSDGLLLIQFQNYMQGQPATRSHIPTSFIYLTIIRK